jgi:hypothetical protein
MSNNTLATTTTTTTTTVIKKTSDLYKRKQQKREEQEKNHPLPSHLKSIDRQKGLGILGNVLDDYTIIQFLIPCFTIPEICQLGLLSRTWLVLSEDDRLWKQFTLNRFGGEFWFEISWKYTYIHNIYLLKNEECPFKGITHNMYAKWSRSNFDLNAFYIPFSHLDRRNCMTVEQFVREYSSIHKPVIITDAMNNWKAFKDFKSDTKEYKQYLLKEYGDVAFKTDTTKMDDWPHWSPLYKQYLQMIQREKVINKREKPSEEMKILIEQLDKTIHMPLKMYMHYMERNRDEDPIYIFDGKFGERAPALLEDYKIPDYFKEDFFEQCLPVDKRPDFRWLVMGPKRSGSAWHMDPYMTSAWNALICGAKRWAFYPQSYLSSDLRVLVDEALREKQKEIEEGYESDADEKSIRAAPLPSYLPCSDPLEWLTEEYIDACEENLRPWECIQYPGELLFVPSGWWHMVLNLDDSIAVTQNFVNTENFAVVFPDIEKRDKHMADYLRKALLEKGRYDLFSFEAMGQQFSKEDIESVTNNQ